MATQSEIKYNRLMEKAEELFLKFGFKAVSMDQIAEAAGIGKMTIYRRFSSKEEFFLEIVRRLMGRNDQIIEAELEKISGTMEKINFLLNYSAEGSKSISFAFYKDIMTIPYLAEKVLEEKNKRSYLLFQNIIREGMEKGEVREGNITFMTDMLIFMMEGFANKYVKNSDSIGELQNAGRELFDFLKYGLLGGKEVE